QEALRGVAFQQFRHMQAQVEQQARDLDEGTAVLALRRGIHDDIAAATAPEAEIAPETGIAGCGLQAVVGEAQFVLQPVPQGLNTFWHVCFPFLARSWRSSEK